MNRREFLNGIWTVGKGVGIFGITGIAYMNYILMDSEKSQSIKRVVQTERPEIIPAKRYALMMTGKGLHQPSTDNTLNLVNRGLQKKGYSEIFRLGTTQGATASDRESLQNAIDDLAARMTDQDSLFFYMMTHGNMEYFPWILGDAIYSLDGGTVTQDDLASLIRRIPSAYTVGFANGCFGAKAAEAIGSGNAVGISPSKLGNAISGGALSAEDKKRYGETISYFSLYFFSAMAGELPDGKKVDSKNDLESLFDYAAARSDERDRFFGWLSNTTPSIFSRDLDPKKIIL